MTTIFTNILSKQTTSIRRQVAEVAALEESEILLGGL